MLFLQLSYNNSHTLVVTVFVAEYHANVNLRVFAESASEMAKLGKEKAVILLNHTSDVDWLIGWILAEKLSMLGVCVHMVW